MRDQTSPLLMLLSVLVALGGLSDQAWAQQPDPPQEPVSTPAAEPEEETSQDPVPSPPRDERNSLSDEQVEAIKARTGEQALLRNLLGTINPPQRQPQTARRSFVVTKREGAPMLDYKKPIICVYYNDGSAPLHMQCDQATKRCLVAEESIFRLSPLPADAPKAAEPKRVPTKTSPAQVKSCYQSISQVEFGALELQGFSMVPAILETPYGYQRDELHRTLQTHFDLRSRLLLGVHYQGSLDLEGDQPWKNTLTVETRSTYEHWSAYNKRRHRFRFIEGELSLAPFRAEGTLFEYDYGRTSDEPLLFIGTMIGPPKRYDIHLGLGLGTTVGRLDYRTLAGTRQVFIDMLEGRVNWEILQGLALEDYLMLRIGAGIGTRRYSDQDTGPLYIYPEASIKSAWLIGARGLGQVLFDASARYGWESSSGVTWTSANVKASGEWVAITISDQPLSVFVQPELEYMKLKDGDAILSGRELRMMAGLRLSLFVPPPPSPQALASGDEVVY